MAKKAKSNLQETQSHGVRYPWEKWLVVGKKKVLKKGKDYLGLSHGMSMTVRQAAKRKGYRVSVQVTEESVVINVLEGPKNA